MTVGTREKSGLGGARPSGQYSAGVARLTPPEPERAPPVAPRVPAVLHGFDPDALDDEYPDIDGVDLDSVPGDDPIVLDLPNAHAVDILRSRLSRTVLDVPADVVFGLQDVIVADVDLTGRRIESAVRVHFVRCRLGGVDFGAARLRDVVFEDCLLDLASWRTATLERVEIRGGRIDGADFASAALTDVLIAGVGFGEVVFELTRLARVDLRAADLTEVLDPTVLRGATISDVQAVVLAARLARAVGIWIAAD